MALPKKRQIKNDNEWMRTGSYATIRDMSVELEQLSKNLRVDNKKRINLGKLAAAEVTSYDAEVKENGVIILHPKVEIPAEELWLWQNKEAMSSVQRGIEDAANGRFAELPEDYWSDIEGDDV